MAAVASCITLLLHLFRSSTPQNSDTSLHFLNSSNITHKPQISSLPFQIPRFFLSLFLFFNQYQYQHQHHRRLFELKSGFLWVRVMRPEEEMDATVNLLAESMLLPVGYDQLLGFPVKQYLLERRAVMPHAVTLVGFYREKEEEGQSGIHFVADVAAGSSLAALVCILLESMKSVVECSTIESNVLLEHAMTQIVDGSSIIDQLAVLPWQASDLLEAYVLMHTRWQTPSTLSKTRLMIFFKLTHSRVQTLLLELEHVRRELLCCLQLPSIAIDHCMAAS
ncbi:hypothetical protein EZV62_017891 [Acer yangbiense]|uniref:Uncharacterized protein n=1 Tax=Acer yangbiense TaxID=1000413 RepID=A0A5C7HIA2_9ROSI|nr:hypothetical protein EZV62_017891 [Acer yangbiense]